jgi:tetratricopeptide (TPR) repeat protein
MLDHKRAEAYYNRGTARYRMRDFDGAIADRTRAIKLKPDFVAAWGDRGAARLAKGDLEGALAEYNRAIELNPASAIGYFNRSLVWRERGDLTRARADYDRAVALDPRLADGKARERIRNRLMRRRAAIARVISRSVNGARLCHNLKPSRRRCNDQAAPLQCAACQLGHIAGILANDKSIPIFRCIKTVRRRRAPHGSEGV